MTIAIVDLSPDEVSARLADLKSVYEVIYNMPAGSGAGFAEMLKEHTQREGFRFCVAEQPSNHLIGFGYGFTGLPGQPWRDSLAKAMGVEVATEWLTGHFEFAEFGLIPSRRRYGIGTQLYERLLGGVPHRRAVLTVREENEPAFGFYQRLGWRVLYQNFFSSTGRGPYNVMGLEIGKNEI